MNTSGQANLNNAASAAIAHFAASASLTTNAEQFVPIMGPLTATIRFPGVIVGGGAPPPGTTGTGEQRVANSLRIRFFGNQGNTHGQTLTVKLYRTPRASVVPAFVGEALTLIPVGAGLQEAESVFPLPGAGVPSGVQYEPGDEFSVSITPSVDLDFAITNISIAVGG